MAGVAQKGPFRQGAMLVATPLDARGARTGAPMRTTIRSDRGDYELVFPAGSLPAGASILLEVTGDFYNEWTGMLSQGSLRAVVPANASPSSWNINLLTELAADDVLSNLRSGMQPNDALRIAEEDLAMELAALTALRAQGQSFHEMDLFDDDFDLLLLSWLFMAHVATDPSPGFLPALTALKDDLMPLIASLRPPVTFDCTMLVNATLRLVLDVALAEATAAETEAFFRGLLPDQSAPTTVEGRESYLATLKMRPELQEALDGEEVKAACNLLGTTATFRLEFRGNWSSANHMGAPPPTGAHFTTLIGATHSTVVHLWEAGQLATPGMESVAEVGGTGTITKEINDHRTAGNVGRLVSASIASGGEASTSFTFQTTKAHPLLSLASMVAPSPDWFVGLDSFSLLESGDWISMKEVMLFAYDAGTEDGNGFSLDNDATSPHEPIARITTAPLGTQTNPLAVITITRTSPP